MVKEESQLQEKVNYISAENAANIKEAEKNLKKCGVKSPSIVFKVPEWQYVDMYIFDEEFYADLYQVFKGYILAYLLRKSHWRIAGFAAGTDALTNDEANIL